MRLDATIDRVQVYCPNASTLGFGKYRAQFGDVVVYRAGDGDSTHIGRVAGRVHYAPPIGEDTTHVRDWLLVLCLSEDLTFVGERWIDPQYVTYVYDPLREGLKLLDRLAFFFGEDFKRESAEELRRYADSGFATPADYRAWRDSATKSA